MALHLFVNVATEKLVHAFQGSTKEAERFMEHTTKQGQPAWHIRIEGGIIAIGKDYGDVIK
jgi:hypothetical protein